MSIFDFFRAPQKSSHVVSEAPRELGAGSGWQPKASTNIQLDQDFKTTLGRVYRDKITGFRGMAIAKTTFLTGCDQTCLRPMNTKEDKVADCDWFDDMRLEIVEGAPSATLAATAPAGASSAGPRNGSDVAPPGGRNRERPRI